MHQCEINALASKYGLEPSKQHHGSDNRARFFLTMDLAGSDRYLQASLSYPDGATGQKGAVQVHVGLYGQRKIADDGTVNYDDLHSAVEDVSQRFKRLRCH
jgi:hypothetical protein